MTVGVGFSAGERRRAKLETARRRDRPDNSGLTRWAGLEAVVHAKDRKKIDRFILFAIKAARQAIEQANWVADTPKKQERTATIITSGMGGCLAITDAVQTVANSGAQKTSPFTIRSFSSIAGLVTSPFATASRDRSAGLAQRRPGLSTR